ncbi:MAG: TetR family transcriptional regulator [Thermomicrobiales bacterium]
MGLRDRKKRATRQKLGEVAFRLFLERGFDAVGVREIADAADVSVTTLFKYFPSKESLVFDEDEEIEEDLVRAVRERPPGVSIPEALRRYMHEKAAEIGPAQEGMETIHHLIEATPSVADYARQMWLRFEDSLSAAIAAEIGAPPDDPRCMALARFALEMHPFIARSSDPLAALDAAFALLEHGWTATVAEGAKAGE